MARRKPFKAYRVTTKEQRIKERQKLRRMQKTNRWENWLVFAYGTQHAECYYCDETISLADRESYHIEHRIPVYHGGKSEYNNLCLACPSCNMYKSTHQLIRNKEFLRKINRNRIRKQRSRGRRELAPVIYL